VFLNPNYRATRIFEVKILRPTTEVFHHLHAFLKADFISLSTKKLYNSHFYKARDPLEISQDPLLGRDPSVEKHCTKVHFLASYSSGCCLQPSTRGASLFRRCWERSYKRWTQLYHNILLKIHFWSKLNGIK